MIYHVTTEQQDILGTENWHAEITDENGKPLSGADGDNEPEAISIAFCFLLGDLPADFPQSLIAKENTPT